MSDVLEIGDSPEDGQTLPCPQCGKPLGPFVTDCPDCTARIVTTNRDSLLGRQKYSFGLGELMLVIGSIAIVLGLIRLSPGVAVVASVVILIALIRILGTLHRARGWKVSMSTWDVVSLIAMSVGISLVIVLSSTIAFFATCLPTGFGAGALFDDVGLLIGFFAGVAIGAVAAIWVARKLVKLLWIAGTPPKLLGIHYLDETPEKPSAAEPSPGKPE